MNTSISCLLRFFEVCFRNKVNQRARQLQLTSTQADILLYLANCGHNRVSLTEISASMGLSHPTVIEVVRRLELNDYVKNVPDAVDRRCRNIQLTDKGMGLQELMMEYRDELDQKLARNIAPEELETFYRVLRQVQENLEGLCGCGEELAELEAAGR